MLSELYGGRVRENSLDLTAKRMGGIIRRLGRNPVSRQAEGVGGRKTSRKNWILPLG
jgi:hypothetical protein